LRTIRARPGFLEKRVGSLQTSVTPAEGHGTMTTWVKHGLLGLLSRTPGIVTLLGLVLASGCIFNPDERCGENQVYDQASLGCKCVPTAIASATGCTPCGANEEPVAGKCSCKTGYKLGATGVCEVSQSLQNTACTPGAACADAKYSRCAPGPAGTGYCTNPCTGAAGCETAGWVCTTWEATPYCKRPPTGVGTSCTTQAQCASFDANVCETTQAKACIVTGCMVTPNTCSGGMACCDYAKVGGPTICVAPGTCPF
jgi:hypothetical protein